MSSAVEICRNCGQPKSHANHDMAHGCIYTPAAVVEPPREGQEMTDYSIVADAVEETLAEFIHPDDVAEPAIYADAIERAAAEVTRLRSALSAAQKQRDIAIENYDVMHASWKGLHWETDQLRTALSAACRERDGWRQKFEDSKP